MRDLKVRSVVAGAAAALLLLATAAAAQTQAPETRLVGVVNVNTATAQELELLPGVGPVRAQAIIDHRVESKGFKQIDDLMLVSGIGEKALARIRPHVAVSGKTTAKLVR